jgi:hypothetical protein
MVDSYHLSSQQSVATEQVEPRAMTVLDLFVLIAGFGIALSLPSLFSFDPRYLTNALAVILSILWLLLCMAIAVSVVAVARQAIYRRPARPAEWLAILLTVNMLNMALPNLDTAVSKFFDPQWQAGDFSQCRWIAAGVATLVALPIFVEVVLMRRVLPPWAKTIGVATCGLILVWGPMTVISLQVPRWFPAWHREAPLTLSSWLYGMACRYIASVPWGLLFGIPATAALLDRRQAGVRRWSWVEWVAGGIAVTMAMYSLTFLYVLREETPADGLHAERIVVPIWIVVVWWLSRMIVRRFGAGWNRLMGDGGSGQRTVTVTDAALPEVS